MNAYSVPSVPPILPKNTSPKTRAAADPNRKKSYHSVAVPIRLANTTLVIERLLRWTSGLVSVVMGVPFWGADGAGADGAGGYAAVQPPSMRCELPVIESVPGPHSIATTCATSSGS